MRKIVLFVGLLLFLGACSEEFQPKPFTYSKLLTGETKKTWRLAAFQFRADGKPVESVVLPSNDCVFDDLYVFYASSDKRFQVNEGRTTCNVEDPLVIVEDTWSLVNATATLEMVIPFLTNFKLPYIVQDLTENELAVEIYFNDDTESYRFVFEVIETE